MFLTCALCAVAAGLLLAIVITKLHRKRRAGEPPLVSGHWLWGSAKDFNLNAVQFLHKSRAEHGDVFTVRMAHEMMTFMLDPHSVEAMSREKAFDFDPIQKQVNNNVFGFELKDSKATMHHIARTTKGDYLEGFLQRYDNILQKQLDGDEIVTGDEGKTIGIREMCNESLFTALFGSVFGTEHHSYFNSKTLFHNFEVFHEAFNYLWLGFPNWLFPDAKAALGGLINQPDSDEIAARPDASEYIKEVVQNMKAEGQTEFEFKAHNLVYLHVNYNTFRLAFWVIYYLLDRPEALKGVRDEIDEFLGELRRESTFAGEADTCRVPFRSLNKLQNLDSIIKESLRMTSGVFMVRKVTKDTNFKTANGKEYHIRKDDKVVYYPPAIHHDKQIFSNPEEFQYDRFVGEKFEKDGKEIKNPVVGFGTICPGKRLAMIQIKWFVVSTLAKWEMSLATDQKAQCDVTKYGHEILPPTQDIPIRIRPRESEGLRLELV